MPLSMLIAFILLVRPFKASLAQEKSGEILQQLEKKEILPKQVPEQPIIEKKEEKPEQIPDGKKILIKQINLQGAALPYRWANP